MAAVYQTGTNAISATAAVDLRTALDAAILTHPNWSLVEAISITGGTARVYKCAGTGANANSWGVDFYIALTVFTATPLVLNLQTFESYTPAVTSQAVRAVRGTSGTLSVAAPGSNSGFVVDNTGYTLDNAVANIGRTLMTLDATNTWSWMAHVSKSRLEIALVNGSVSVTAWAMAGVYVPNPRASASNASVFPLFMAGGATIPMAYGTNGNVGFSRAFLTGASAVNNIGSFMLSSMNIAGCITTAGALIDGVEGTVRGTGIVVTGPIISTATTAAVGFLRGSLPGLYGFQASNTNFPRALDLIVLSDATRLAPLGTVLNSPLLLTNVDADF